MTDQTDWTVSLVSGRSNDSEEFHRLCKIVEDLIRNSAFDIVNGRSDRVAALILAQLAHVHGMRPVHPVVSR